MIIKNLNLVLRFLLELSTLAALGYWGFQVGRNPFARFVLGIGAPLLAAAAWGMFVSPKAQVSLPEPTRVALALLILGSGALALAAAERYTLAWVFAATILINTLLLVVWKQ